MADINQNDPAGGIDPAAPPPAKEQLRFTSERLPYRRAGLVFAGSRILEVPATDVTREQAMELYADPVISIAYSTDAGETFVDLPEPDVEALLAPAKVTKTKS